MRFFFIKKRNGEIWISVVLYLMIIVAVTLLILNVGLPILNKLRDKVAFSKAEENMLALNQHLRDVASEGQGSQRLISIDVREGKFKIQPDRLEWIFDTAAMLIDPRSLLSRGDVKIISNADVSASDQGTAFTLDNSLIMANISKIGNSTSWGVMNTSVLLKHLKLKSNGAYVYGNFTFSINDNPASTYGNGYTSLPDSGSDLGYAVVVAHVNSSVFEYDLKLTLESRADFLRAELDNVRPK